mgnify:CR=1 FL=1
MSNLLIPKDYKAALDLKQTELAIKQIKDFFLRSFSTELRLRRVTAPLFVLRGLGYGNFDAAGSGHTHYYLDPLKHQIYERNDDFQKCRIRCHPHHE